MPEDFSEEKTLEQLDAMAANMDSLDTFGNLESLTFDIKHFDASANFAVTASGFIDPVVPMSASANFSVTATARGGLDRTFAPDAASFAVTSGAVEAVRLKPMTPAPASFTVTDNFYFTRNLGTTGSMNGIVNASANCTAVFSMAADVTGVLTTQASAQFVVYIYPDSASVSLTATAAEPARLNYINTDQMNFVVTATAECSVIADMPADTASASVTSDFNYLRIKHFTVDEDLSLVASNPVLAKLGEEWTVIQTQSANFAGNPANNQTWFIQ